MKDSNRPIGVFDSGIGGLTVIRAMRKLLPGENLVYLGDTARVPYGTKSHGTIERYTLQAGSILHRHAPKLIVIACNTASAHGLAALQEASACPILGVIEPGAAEIARQKDPVGVLGTLATIQSEAYERAIRRHQPQMRVVSIACPLLVALAEEGWFEDPITEAVIDRYLKDLPDEVRSVVLGCTHYPLLLPAFKRCRPAIHWVDSGEVTALEVEKLLRNGLGFRTEERGYLRVMLTDTSSRLIQVGSRILGEPLEAVELVEL